jgi:hypothetical protein
MIMPSNHVHFYCQPCQKKRTTLPLPPEILLTIFESVAPDALASLRLVCRAIQKIIDNVIIDNEHYWQKFLHKSGDFSTSAKKAYLEVENIDLNTISLSTFCLHPKRDKYIQTHCLSAEASPLNQLIHTITYFDNKLKKLAKDNLQLTAAEGIEQLKRDLLRSHAHISTLVKTN